MAKHTEERRVELMPLSAIKEAGKNPKAHDLATLQASLVRFGFVEGLALDERTRRLVAGHGRLAALRAMKERGDKPPAGVVVEGGEWLVPVQRGWASKSGKDAEGYLIASNRIGENGGWEGPTLRSMLTGLEGEDLVGIGFTDKEVGKFLGLAPKGDDGPPEVKPAEVYVKAGELWKLGQHRLLIGDNTVPENLERLMGEDRADAMIEDPPYAIFGSSTGIGKDIADDKMIRPFMEGVCNSARRWVKTFGHVYIFTDWRSWGALWEGARRAELTPANCLVWDKGGAGLGSMWANTHEFVGFFTNSPKAIASRQATGQRMVNAPNVLHYNRVPGGERNHNAAKPVELLAQLVEASTDAGQVVADFYLGGGSTLIACEETGRICRGTEIEPRFAQSIIARWETKTGHKAELVK